MHIDFSRLWRRGQGIKISISLAKIQEKAGAELCQADFVVVLVVVAVVGVMNVIVVALFVVVGNIIFSCCQ